MGVFLDPKLKKIRTFFDLEAWSENLAREGLAFFPVAPTKKQGPCIVRFRDTIRQMWYFKRKSVCRCFTNCCVSV